MNKAGLVFFGSGPVATKTLQGLTKTGFKLEAVITKPKPAHHRGEFPVLRFCAQHKIASLTPQNKQELSELFSQKRFKSPLGLVVDYGLIIPADVIEGFEKGIVNSHFSLLPQLRGADPITFAILSGQTETGVSLMLIDEKLDEGPLLVQKNLKIALEETAPSLTVKLIALSNQMLAENLPRYLAGELLPYPQPKDPPTYSRKLTKEDGVMDWSKPTQVLEREVRAYAGWPKSTTKIFGQKIIVTSARLAEGEKDGALVMKASPGYLEILQLIAPSGRTMSGADFIRGYGK